MNVTILLETVMLVCFGIAWPLANLRMLRTRRAEGKGMVFTLIVFTGYIAGALAKVASVHKTDMLPGLFWLYALNGASVAINLGLQWHFGRCQRRAAIALNAR